MGKIDRFVIDEKFLTLESVAFSHPKIDRQATFKVVGEDVSARLGTTSVSYEVEHPCYTELKKHLEKYGYITKNADGLWLVIQEFTLNDVWFKVGANFRSVEDFKMMISIGSKFVEAS